MKSLPPNVRLADLYASLGTEDGQRLVGELHRDLLPYLSDKTGGQGMLEPFGNFNEPTDRFEKKIFSSLRQQFILAYQAGSYLPATVLSALAELSDDAGVIASSTVEGTLGPVGLQFLQRLHSISRDSPPSALADRELLEPTVHGTEAEMFEKLGIDSPRLEALELIADLLADPDEFLGFEMLAVQHLFQSTESLLDLFEAYGIPYGDMTALGKIYSTNWATVGSTRQKGVNVPAASMNLMTVGATSDLLMTERANQRAALSAAFRGRMRETIAGLPNPPEAGAKPQIMMLDDGALALSVLHEPEFIDWAPYFCCVEQTSQGARILHELEDSGRLNCAVANVAETWAKMLYESPMIGHSVVLEIERTIAGLEAYGVARPKEATVIGYGNVGRAVAQALSAQGYTVHIYDDDPEKLLAAQIDGFEHHRSKAEALGFGHILVGCSGELVVDADDAANLPNGAVMFNAASGDDEFDCSALRTHEMAAYRDEGKRAWGAFNGHVVSLGTHGAEAHCDRVIQIDGKDILLANNGYVINMTGERDPIPARYIQLTRALLFLGALAAKRADGPGIVDIPLEWQRALVSLVERILARTGENLLDPSWEKLDGTSAPVVHDVPWEVMLLTMPETTDRIAQARVARGVQVQGAVSVRELRQFTDGEEASEDVLASTYIPTAWPVGTVYGYQIGPVAVGSLASTVDESFGNADSSLSVSEAALHRALTDINEVFHAQLKVRVQPEELAPEPAGPSDGAGDDHERFEIAYGQYLTGMLKVHLRRSGSGTPHLADVAHGLARILRHSGIKPDRWLEHLDRSKRPEERALATMIRKLL